MYLGDFVAGDTVDFNFTTRRFSTGAPHQLAGTPAVRVYKGSSTTEDDSGITLTVDFDTRTGLNHVTIDTSADGTFYANGGQFEVVITAGTVDSVSVVGEVVGRFTLRAQAALYPTTAGRTLDVSAGGEAGVDWANIGSPTTAVNLSSTNIDVDQIVASVSGAVGSVTGNVGGNVVGSVGSISGITFPNNFSALVISAGGTANADMVAVSTDTTAADNLETMLDGTGGKNLTLGRLVVSHSDTTPAFLVENKNLGSGDAVKFSSTGGNGLTVSAGGHGAAFTGSAGFGLSVGGGGGGATFESSGSGYGLRIIGAGADNPGLYVTSGNADAAYFQPGSGDRYGIACYGSGSESGFYAKGGATGPGAEFVGGGTSGAGLEIVTTDGDAVLLNATGSGKVSLNCPDGITAAITGNITGSLSGSVGSVTGNVGGNVAGSVGSVGADGITSTSLAATAGSELATALLDLTDGVESGITVRQLLRATGAALAGVLSGAATTTVTIKAINNSGTTRVTATVDADGNRSGVTLNL